MNDILLSGEKENELLEKLHSIPLKQAQEAFQQLMLFGGFPEPFALIEAKTYQEVDIYQNSCYIISATRFLSLIG